MRRLLPLLGLLLTACAPLGEAVVSDTRPTTAAPASSSTSAAATSSSSSTSTSTSTTVPAPARVPAIDAALEPGLPNALSQAPPFGRVDGLVMFRGNPTRTWYGKGPVPADPEVLWRFGEMCGPSSVGSETRIWCGSGWTGQPVVWNRPDGITEVIFGAYDHSVHFLDAATGEPTRPEFPTGDIIKGSVTLDPDGFPLLYFGSRDNRLRIVGLDRETPEELWSIDAADWNGIWNDDWDGNPLILDDILFEGGENGIFYAARLNRSYDLDGLVTVDPTILVAVNGWDQELLDRVGNNVSIENSVAYFDDTVYFANSGGRVLGLDVTAVEEGTAPVVLDFWAGDDIDATIVIDEEGMLYVSAELERFNSRAEELGQLIKLDPSRPDDPYVWGVPVPGRGGDGGLWATPALGEGVLYAATHPGELLVVDTATGEVVWRDQIGSHAWSSPVLVDDTLVVAVDCEAGGALRAYDVSDPQAPSRLWQMDHGSGCIESTPAVWEGRIYVGSRDGYFYAFG